ncbi:MAG TPA: FHA domain-containing protein [Anaerolineae bacterium]|nr:FHA domain-containing protein [Anaerolineae bacterium]HQH38474.1 FHA domain-containing protein [Anaerolineae bacterium]
MEKQIRRLLVVTEGPNKGQSYVLQGMICTLGRTTDNTIVIDSPRVSRHHTQIRLLPDGAVVEDMGSTNGTWLNNRRLSGPQRLAPGDIIGLADDVALRYEVEAGAPMERLMPAMSGAPTSATNDMFNLPAPPPPPGYQERYRSYEETPAPSFASVQPEPSPVSPPDVAPRRKYASWVYIVVAVLLILILVCAAVAIYLWFAPVEFWQKVFAFFNIPLP